jgi:transposase-like protein
MGELPPANIKRWVVRRKAAVVAAVQSGEITLEEACRRYQLSEEEFRAWQRAYEAHGLRGLRATACSSIAPRRGPGAAWPWTGGDRRVD